MPSWKNSRNLYFAFFAIYFSYFWLKVGVFDHAGNFLLRQSNMWADWALHFTLGSTLAEQSLWHQQNPLLINSAISYPPAVNSISALLINLDIPFFQAFIIPSYIFTLLITIALYYFFKQILRSAKAAVAASLLFLFNGGLGFYYYFSDILNSSHPLKTLVFPPQEYTDMPEKGIHFMSFLTSMVYPQRAFALGFPAVLLALTLIFKLLYEEKVGFAGRHRYVLFIAALTIGISPLLHPHASLAAAVILISWFLFFLEANWGGISSWKKFKGWLLVGAGSVIAGAASLLFYNSGSLDTKKDFISINPGFMAAETEYSWLGYWLLNWGLTPYLALAGWFILVGKKSSKAKILLPFLLLFMAANIWQFQPWIWDNMKLLAWSALGISALAVYTLQQFWNSKSKLAKLAAAAAFAAGIFSGTLELVRNVQFSQHEYTIYTREELELAEWAKNNTRPESIWLSGTRSNNWAYNLTGRQPVMAYPGWLASHGYDIQNAEEDISLMLSKPATNLNLFAEYQIDFISIGPMEEYFQHADKADFEVLFPVVKESERYTIYSTEKFPISN